MPATRARGRKKVEKVGSPVSEAQSDPASAVDVSKILPKKLTRKKEEKTQSGKNINSSQFDEVDGVSSVACEDKKTDVTSEPLVTKVTVLKDQKLPHTKRDGASGTLDVKQRLDVKVADTGTSALSTKKRKAEISVQPSMKEKKARQGQKVNHADNKPELPKVKVERDGTLKPEEQSGVQGKTFESKRKQNQMRKGQSLPTERTVKSTVTTKPASLSHQQKIQAKGDISSGDSVGKSTLEISSVHNHATATENTSSSDSDFEEVHTPYRTPESSFTSSACSGSGVCRRLESSFSDIANSEDQSVSFTGGQSTSFSSTSFSVSGTDCSLSDNYRVKGKTKARGKITSAVNSNPKTGGHGQKGQGKRTKVTPPGKKCGKSKPAASISHKTCTTPKPDENDVMALLMQMEGQPRNSEQTALANKSSTSGKACHKRAGLKRKPVSGDMTNSDSNEESDWEEVEDYRQSPVKSQIPDGPVEITIDDPGMMHKKRKKKEFDWQAYIQRKIKRRAREIQVDIHKVSLLCLLAHGMQQNQVCSDPSVCATALSLVPVKLLKKDVAFHDEQTLLMLVQWFRTAFSLTSNSDGGKQSLVGVSQLLAVITGEEAGEARLFVMVLVALLRAVGFSVRLVMSLRPAPLKQSAGALSKSAPKTKKEHISGDAVTCGKKGKETPTPQKTATVGKAKPAHTEPKCSKSASKKSWLGTRAAMGGNKGRQVVKKGPVEDRSSGDEGGPVNTPSSSKRRLSTRPRKCVKSCKVDTSNVEGDSGEDYVMSSASDGSDFSEEEEVKRRRKKKGIQSKSASQRTLPTQGAVAQDKDSDEEFDHSWSIKTPTIQNGERPKKANRKILSADNSPEKEAESTGRNYWLEVFLPRPNKWFCVDCIRCTVGKPYDTSAAASKPVLYVLGFANDGSVKDITAKYAPQWLSHTRKQRVDGEWWRESLQPHTSTNTALDHLEDRHIKDHLVQRPLPTSIGDFKNHPLYALRRHLLKYEAIYPESSIPVGYIRSEPVYARECVHTLHSRENWLREARVVRIGETAYKMVKSRKRWNRMRDNPEELDLELFGRWQTEDYIPPPAVDGKVPKNEYGNVELFQPSMLPGGTVHVRVPALNRVAKKLGIDIAAAMTGWDHHCGFSHPVLDGWIVCEEHKDVLLAAWEEDQEIQRQREEERREKRVIGNWTTLVRGLLIKEKLKKKFNLEEKPAQSAVKKQTKIKKGQVATDAQQAWPARQQQQKTKKDKPVLPPSHYTVETM